MNAFATRALGLTALFACPLLASPATAAAPDSAAPGYGLDTQATPAMPVHPPVFGAAVATLTTGELVTCDGRTVELWTAAGGHVRTLGTLPQTGFPSFLEVDPLESFAILGESSHGNVYVAQLDGSGLTFVAQILLNYDAVFDAAGDVYLSARSSGTGLPNRIHRIALPGGVVTQAGEIAGPSGPLAFTVGGDLLYATQVDAFPPPPGSTDVLSWSRALLSAGTPLTAANAVAVATGFDGASSMAVDPGSGELYLADNNFGTSVFVLRRVGLDPPSSPILARAPSSFSQLQFLPAKDPLYTCFSAYQPDAGPRLRYTTTDFFSFDSIRTLHPARPTLTVSGPGTTGVGPFTLTVEGGVPNGAAFLVFSQQAKLQPETGYAFPGFLWYTTFDPVSTRRMPFYLPADPRGKSELVLHNPGNLGGKFAYQAWVSDAGGGFLGSSTVDQF